MIILGIDPGSIVTGFGVINYFKNKQNYITSGCIKVGKKEISNRLSQIYMDLTRIIDEFKPDIVSIEQVFVHKNVSSALKLGQARGAAIVACANKGLEIAEYAPRQIKQAVVGYGGAEKVQVQQMVKALLNLSDVPQADAADALAVAICHLQSRKVY